MQRRTKNSLYIRNFIFGVEDSLVSTVGLLSGIATGDLPHRAILLTGVVYVFVEAFSMAVGSFLSEEFAEEYVAKSRVSDLLPFLGGAVMFVSFVIAGFIPILPYLIFQGAAALYSSILFSLAALFGLGVLNGRMSGVAPWSRAVRMVVLGGLAIAIGVLVGQFFKVG